MAGRMILSLLKVVPNSVKYSTFGWVLIHRKNNLADNIYYVSDINYHHDSPEECS